MHKDFAASSSMLKVEYRMIQKRMAKDCIVRPGDVVPDIMA